MIEVFKNVNIDWLANRRLFIAVSVLLMLAGLGSAVARQWSPGGTEAFNLGVDFKGGTVVTARFKQRPSAESIRDALNATDVKDSVIQHVIDKPNIAIIKLPLVGSSEAESQAQLDQGRARVKNALAQF